MPSGARLALLNVLVATAYLAAAQLGLLVPFTNGTGSPLWPPSGIALAAVLFWGPSVLPGVFAGSFLTTLSIGGGPLGGAGAALGNTVEPAMAWLLLRRVGFRPSFERVSDASGFVIFAALLSTAVSATCGVLSLHATGLIDRAHVAGSWVSWWTGNGMGVLLVTPLLTGISGPRLLPPVSVWRLAMLVGGTVVTLLLVFGPPNVLPTELREEILLIPFLVWAAIDHGPRGALVACLAVSTFALWRTLEGDGPFVRDELWSRVWLVQVFAGVSTITSLVLGAAIVERRRAVELRDEFISVASHELKTPLTTLNLELDALRMEAAQLPTVLRMRDTMQRQLDRLARLVNAMLDIARLTGGSLPVEAEEVDVAALAKTVAERSMELFVEAGTRLEVIAEGPIWCACDRLRIDQAISNLLSNAAKYGAGKPVSLEVKREGGEVHVSVRDEGIGIAPEDHQRIFQRFERADPDRAIAGLGLGLYIVSQIVSAHRGRVEVDSEIGQGARFTIALPLG